MSTLNSATGNVTLNTVGIYTAKCFVDGQNITPNVCQKTLEVKAIPVFILMFIGKTLRYAGLIYLVLQSAS